MKNKTNILITGASGFIGSRVLNKLIQKNTNYIFLLIRDETNLSRISNHINSERVSTFFFDNIEEVFKKNEIDFVIHLATNYIKFDKPNEHESLIEDNVNKPSKIVNLAIKHNVKGFINTGTFFEVDEGENLITEDSKIYPFNFYAKTKIEFQDILDQSSNVLNSVTLRLFSPYGPNDNQKVIPLIIKSIIDKEDLVIENPNINCDFTYVDDIALGYEKTIKKMNTNFKLPKIINICSGNFYKLDQVVESLRSISRTNINVDYKSLKEIELKRSSNKLAKDLLGWIPKTSLESGLKLTYDFYKNLEKDA